MNTTEARVAANEAAPQANPDAKTCCECNGSVLALDHSTCGHCKNAGVCPCSWTVDEASADRLLDKIGVSKDAAKDPESWIRELAGRLPASFPEDALAINVYLSMGRLTYVKLSGSCLARAASAAAIREVRLNMKRCGMTRYGNKYPERWIRELALRVTEALSDDARTSEVSLMMGRIVLIELCSS
jgi:hypothetical protein